MPRTLPIRIAAALLVASVAGALLAGCGDSGAPAVRVSGKLVYQGKHEPPKDATARISIFEQNEDGADKRIVAELSLHEVKTQPIGFRLQVDQGLVDPNGQYGIRAQVRDAAGRLAWHTVAATPIQPTSDAQQLVLELAPVGERRRLSFQRYRCADGFHLGVASNNGKAVMRLGNRRLVLDQASIGPERSVYADEHGNMLAIGARSAVFAVDGADHDQCWPVVTKRSPDEKSNGRTSAVEASAGVSSVQTTSNAAEYAK